MRTDTSRWGFIYADAQYESCSSHLYTTVQSRIFIAHHRREPLVNKPRMSTRTAPTAQSLSHSNLSVLLLYVLLYWIMYPGCFTGWDAGFIGGARGDSGILIAVEKINANRFFSSRSEGFNLPIYFPWHRTLAFSDNFLLPSLLAKILFPIFQSDSVVFNLIQVSGLILNGFCAFLLSKRLTNAFGPSVLAGFIFMCFPYFYSHRGHPQLYFAFWIPLTLLATFTFAEKRTAFAASGIGACVTGAFFCSVYYSMYCYLLAAVALGSLILARPRTVRPIDLFSLCAGNVVWLLLLAPSAIPYMEVRDAMGTNPYDILRQHSPSLSAFIAAPWGERLWAQFTHRFSRMEGYLFFGMLPLLLAIGTVAELMKKPLRASGATCVRMRALRWLSALALVTTIVGIARGIHFASHPGTRTVHHLAWVQSQTFWLLIVFCGIAILTMGWKSQRRSLLRSERLLILLFITLVFTFGTLGIKEDILERNPAPMIYRYMMMLPGYEALRGLSRMGVIPVLTSVIIATFGISEIVHRRFGQAKPRSLICFITLFGLCGFELTMRREQLAHIFPAPAIYETARNLPSQEAVLALPISSVVEGGRNFMNWNSVYMQWMAESPNPLVNGFSGKAPWYHSVRAHLLDTFPSRHSLSLIGGIVGVRYVITNRVFTDSKFTKRILKEFPRYPEEVELLSCDDKKNCLFKVSPVIDTSMSEANELVVESAAAERALQFEIRPSDPRPTLPITVTMRVVADGRHHIHNESFTLNPNDDWSSKGIQLPGTKNTVNPLQVKIAVTNAPGVLIRNAHVAPGAEEPQD